MDQSEGTRPKVFISYAHADAFDFTRQLAFDLGFYADVFWDRHLEAGPFPEQIYDKIKDHDYFILVISPSSLRKGGWCRRELECAEVHHRNGIMLARIYSSPFPPRGFEKQLIDEYTYGNFTEDFDAGFRHLTQMMVGEPRSSWEYLSQESDPNVLINEIGNGHIPGMIVKNIAEWALVEKLWAYVDESLSESARCSNWIIIRGTPHTPLDILRQLPQIMEQLDQHGDVAGYIKIQQMQQIVEDSSKSLLTVADSEHVRAGQMTYDLLKRIHDFLLKWLEANRRVAEYKAVQTYFYPEVADKLRELIAVHARRSRYLY